MKKISSIRHITVAVAAIALSFIATTTDARNGGDRDNRVRDRRNSDDDGFRFGRAEFDRRADRFDDRFEFDREDRLRRFRRADDRFDDDRRAERFRRDDRNDRNRDSGNKRRHRRGSR